jgi:putative transposase
LYNSILIQYDILCSGSLGGRSFSSDILREQEAALAAEEFVAMSRLQHRTMPGCTYFVTTKSFQSSYLFQSHAVADTVVVSLLRYRENYFLHSFVLMPNHLHLLLTPQDNCSLEKAMQLIKGGSSYEVHKESGGKMPLWQSGFHEETVRDQGDYLSKVNYIHQNPVAARLVGDAAGWKWTSASGLYVLDPMPKRLNASVAAKRGFLRG